EDGIRDPLVTGVQTCALPISAALIRAVRHPFPVRRKLALRVIERRLQKRTRPPATLERKYPEIVLGFGIRFGIHQEPSVRRPAQIGRASCRETATQVDHTEPQ